MVRSLRAISTFILGILSSRSFSAFSLSLGSCAVNLMMDDFSAAADYDFADCMTVMHAFGELMRKEPIDKLKIAKICERAEISRSTFYQLFRGKFDVAQWLHRYIMVQGANEIGHTVTFQEGYRTSISSRTRRSRMITMPCSSSRPACGAFENTITRFYVLDYTDYRSFPFSMRLPIWLKPCGKLALLFTV